MSITRPTSHQVTSSPARAPLDRRGVLSGRWVSLLLVFAYVDIFGFWREDLVRGVLAGEVVGPGFEIDQGFLVLTMLYVLVPCLMVAATLIAPYRLNRGANLVVASLYALTVIGAMVGETWVYYLLGSAVELVLLVLVVVSAWRWR
jgi:hypothetical protein